VEEPHRAREALARGAKESERTILVRFSDPESQSTREQEASVTRELNDRHLGKRLYCFPRATQLTMKRIWGRTQFIHRWRNGFLKR
jgi:hypothetical protein